MTVEKTDRKLSYVPLDPYMEIRTVIYPVSELLAGGLMGVISQNFTVQHFLKENPELVVKKVYSFKMNQADQTVTLKVRVTKRKPAPIAKTVDENGFTLCKGSEEEKPITDPARLLLPGEPPDAGSKETADLEIHDEFATLNDEVYFKTLGDANARIADLEKQLEYEKLAVKVVRYEMNNFQAERDVAEARIEKLETENAAFEVAINYALDDLPQSPDKAKHYLVHVLKKEENEGAGEQNGTD